MNNKVSLNRHDELPLKHDKANLFLEIMMAITVFLFAVALSGYFLVSALTGNWNASVKGSLTVQIMPATETLTEEEQSLRINKVITYFENLSGVDKVLLVSDKQMQQLMSPWLGETTDINDLPLPKLLDVYLTDEDFDYQQASSGLKEVAPYASVNNHRLWLHRLLQLADSVKSLAWAILLLVLIVCVLSVFYATCTSLGIHKDIIEILHIMGATDDYVAKQYAYRGLKIGFFSGLLGIVMAFCAFAMLSHVASDMEQGLIGDLSLNPLHKVMLLLLPPATALICMLTSYFAVKRTLRKIM